MCVRGPECAHVRSARTRTVISRVWLEKCLYIKFVTVVCYGASKSPILMLNGLKYVYMNQNRFSERIGASWRPETSFGGLGGQKRVSLVDRALPARENRDIVAEST